MKLLRYGRPGREKPGLLDQDGRIRDLSDMVADISSATLTPALLRKLARVKPDTLPLVRGKPRLGPPVAGISKIVAIGLNYADHAAEAGAAIPSEPIVFMKAPSAVAGPDDTLMLPKGSKKTDWEVELAAVIGSRAQHVDEKQALEHVAGYCVCNDVSEREYQLERGGQWVKGKSADGFAPLGPWLVTPDEVPDPQNLRLWLEVNGKMRQNGNTKTMIFGMAQLISYVSRFMTLLPGDVITTGTPPGVAMGMKTPRYLKAGDVVRLGIDGLGEQRQEVVKYAAG